MMWLHAECNNNVGMNPFLFLYIIYTLFFQSGPALPRPGYTYFLLFTIALLDSFLPISTMICRAIILCLYACFLVFLFCHLELFLSVPITSVIYRVNSFCVFSMTNPHLAVCLDLGFWENAYHVNSYIIIVLSGASLSLNIFLELT